MTTGITPYLPGSIEELRRKVAVELAEIGTPEDAEKFRIDWLGKKGIVRELFRSVSEAPPAERKDRGREANELRELAESGLEARLASIDKGGQAVEPSIDCTMPGLPFPRGSLHPLMTIRNRIRDIFMGMGFSIAYGPDIESDYYNFEALNFQPDHPARDMQDTFHIAEKILLRTHTSPVQIRVMETLKPPIRSIMPGRVYRNEEISARSSA